MKDDLIKLIDKNKVISFDIFDTLLLRNIYRPTDIFRILDKIAFEKYGIKNFFELRIESEKGSRIKSNNYECHFDEIYTVINKTIKDKNTVSKLKKEELLLEEKFLVPNPFMLEIYKYCVKKNKTVLFISDMYLDEAFINKVLKKCGYVNYKLYLSNVYRKTKGDSSLFELVFKKEKINKEFWLHIGDNNVSDYTVPINFGINAYHYNGVYEHTTIKKYSIFEAIILGIQNNYLYNGLKTDYWDAFGVKNVSTIYFGFTKWLYDLTKNLDNLFFIARDGYIIKKIYEAFNKDKKIHTGYLYCSRKSFVIPSLYKLPTEEMVNVLSIMYNPNVRCTLRQFLLNCEVSLDDVDNDVLAAFGFQSLDILLTSDNIYNAKKLLVTLSNCIRKNLKDKYDLAVKYLKEKGVDDYSLINIMDIGWAGSIQSSIKRLLGKEINGYYFGTIDEDQKNGFSTMFGYFFDLSYELQNKQSVLDNVMMYELIFSAPHGSTIGYKEVDGKILPVLKSNREYNKIVECFQKSAINIVKEYLKYIDYFDFLSKDFCIYSYRNFIKEKNYNDVIMFKQLSNDYILGNDKKFNYVNVIDREEIDDVEKLMKKANDSLWTNTFVVDDNAFDEKEYLFYKNILLTHYYFSNPLFYVKLYLDYGEGFNELDTVFIPLECNGNQYKFKYRFNQNKTVYNLRIDPVERRKIIMRNLVIFSDVCNAKVIIPHKNFLLGKLKKCIYISSKDPKIIINNVENYKYIDFSSIIELV